MRRWKKNADWPMLLSREPGKSCSSARRQDIGAKSRGLPLHAVRLPLCRSFSCACCIGTKKRVYQNRAQLHQNVSGKNPYRCRLEMHRCKLPGLDPDESRRSRGSLILQALPALQLPYGTKHTGSSRITDISQKSPFRQLWLES